MWYKLSNDGAIEACSPSEIAGWENTSKNIVRNYDGILVFEEETQTEDYILSKAKRDNNLAKKIRVTELKELLKATDYIFIKAAEASLLGFDPPYSVAQLQDLQATRQAHRDEINTLEGELNDI